MPVSEKQKEYVKRHQQEKTDTVTIRPPKGTKEQWQAAAKSLGTSLQRFVIDSVNAAVAAIAEDSPTDT